ncbi:MAG: hypothetical protein AMJ58_02425 [Gammaproteobacteria bacterium SG8_30]|nr:MAG: hypothetical protein AMJ58_02425 [Gammaproteobacteria bacterium SG8_30]
MSVANDVVIQARFRGPPESGNGGYVCGILGAAADELVAVRLRRPPPLDVPLTLERTGEGLVLRQGDDVVATARPDPVDIEVPAPPDHAEAIEASLGYSGFAEHPFPGCFVCGPRRLAGDGLRIFPGPLAGRSSSVAAPWIPDGTLAGQDRRIRPEFLWAALDCPGYFATPLAGRLALLGELAVRIEDGVEAGEPCVVSGWLRHSDGRKHLVGTALFGRDGRLVARAAATWIELR